MGTRNTPGTATTVQASALARSARWCLYFDVRKYYEHIDKGVLFADLQRVIKDRRALALLRQVLTLGARGLPIGNTLSHLFANFYLTNILRAIERLPGVSGLACYMDNVHILSASKRKLHRARNLLSKYFHPAALRALKAAA